MKLTKFSLTLTAFVFVFSSTTVLAQPPEKVVAHVTKTPVPVNVTIPEHAVEVAPDVFDLGEVVTSEGETVRGYAFVHYRKGFGHKPNHNPGNGGGGSTSSTCYSFLANGARWKNTENYLFDATNSQGLNEATLHSLLAASLEIWDREVSFDIFGNEVAGAIDAASIGVTTNDQNEVVFGDIDSPGAIAVTYVWGIFYGKPSQRKLVEWDQVYDQVDFQWSLSGEAGKMDFLNIAVHEDGHALGLGHPSDSCTEETMYRFADFGETKKQTLEAGDIAGISKLY